MMGFSFKGLSKCFHTIACWELNLLALMTDGSCLFPSIYSSRFTEISFSFFHLHVCLVLLHGSTSCQVQTRSRLPQDLIRGNINLLGNIRCVLLSSFAKSLSTFCLFCSLSSSHTVQFVRVLAASLLLVCNEPSFSVSSPSCRLVSSAIPTELACLL